MTARPSRPGKESPSPELILSFRANLRACTSCTIHANTGGPIPWSGDVDPHYAVLGEAPGRTEMKRGVPFVGDSGAILRHWLKQEGIDPSVIVYLNAVACGPNRTPTPVEMTNCRPWVYGQLDFIRPTILITLGNVAFKQLRHPHGWLKLADLHGKPWTLPRYPHMTVFSTYHPAAYLRGHNKSYEKKITTDLHTVATWDGEPLDECYLCGDALYRYDEYGIGFCLRHAGRQGILFPEDITA